MPDFLAAMRPRPDWLPRASVGLGIAATVAMNVAAGSRGGTGGALTGTLTPVGFVVSLETLIFLVRRLARLDWGWAWCAGAGLPLAALAGITGVISYLHALTVAEWTASPGEAGLPLTEHLLPLVADLMILTGSVALVALAVAGKRPAQPEPRHGDDQIQRPAETRETRRSEQSMKPEPASQPQPVPRRAASQPARLRGRRPGNRVRDLVADLPPERLAELSAMSKRDLAARLSVTPWAAEVWLRENRAPAVNGSK